MRRIEGSLSGGSQRAIGQQNGRNCQIVDVRFARADTFGCADQSRVGRPSSPPSRVMAVFTSRPYRYFRYVRGAAETRRDASDDEGARCESTKAMELCTNSRRLARVMRWRSRVPCWRV